MSRLAQASMVAAVVLVASAPDPAAAAGSARHMPSQVIVRFAPSAGGKARAAALRRLGASVVRPLPQGHELLHLASGTTVARAVASLGRDPAVLHAEPNTIAELASTCPAALKGLCLPNDPRFQQQASFYNTGQVVAGKTGKADADVDAVDAWNVARTGESDVVVASVDSGVDYNNPDLAPHMWTNPGETGTDANGADKRTNGVDDDNNGYVDDWRGWDVVGHRLNAVDPDNNPRDLRGHGTHVAGILAAVTDNLRGVAGIAANARIMPVRVQGQDAVTTDADLAEGMAYAADNHARIVNISLAQDAPSELLTAVVLAHPDTLYVVAAGNLGLDLDKPGNQVYPCEIAAPNIVCVGATDNRDVLASFSNKGKIAVDLTGPGTPIVSTQPAWQTLRTYPFNSDPFAGSAPLLTRGAAPGSTNTWAWNSTVGHGGLGSITDSPAGPYVGPSNTWVQTTTALDLTGREGCSLMPWLRDDLTPGDAIYVQASPNGQFDTADPEHSPQTVQWWTGSEGTLPGVWRPVDLLDVEGTPVYLRFGLISRSPNTALHDGGYLDDITAQCLGSVYSATGLTELAVMAGTSMATPHVAAVAALVQGRHPDWTPAQVKATVLRSVDVVPALVPVTVTGGRVNAYKAIAESSASVSGGVLTFHAGDGETNNVVVTRATISGVASYLVADAYGKATTGPQTGSRITPGAGCVSVSDTSVRCAVAGVTAARFELGDLNDTFTSTTVPIPTTVIAGAGDDTVTTGAGADRLEGGPGVDVLTGGPGVDAFLGGDGNDRIVAKDGVVNSLFDCGEGAVSPGTDVDVVSADVKDPVKASKANCETVTH